MNMDKIVDALRVIKQVCGENETCYYCPLYCQRIQKCGLSQRPDCITIKDPTLTIIK